MYHKESGTARGRTSTLLRQVSILLIAFALIFQLLLATPASFSVAQAATPKTRDVVLNGSRFATGRYHSLFIDGEGALWSWGGNEGGQLGDGTKTDSDRLIHIGSDTDWVSVAGGDDHSLALKSDGSLWSWGLNNQGQLGQGDTTARLTPTRVGTDTDWVAIDASGNHSTALKSDGSAWGAGANQYSAIGNNTTSTNCTTFTRANGTGDYTVLSAGGYHTVAVKRDGTLWAWGQNMTGQYGNGSTDATKAPQQVGTATDWADAQAGFDHSLYLKTDGTVWIAGGNGWGQQGTGESESMTVAYPDLKQMLPGQRALRIATGEYTSAVITDQGELWTWGYNNNGQAGQDSYRSAVTPARVGTDDDWVSVRIGTQHMIAEKADGSLWTWGTNENGQLGRAMGFAQPDITAIDLGTATVATVQAGYLSSAILTTDGRLFTCGYDSMGTVANGLTNLGTGTPYQVGGNDWAQVSAGQYHMLALKKDGTLWAWGGNTAGQLGDSAAPYYCSHPYQVGTDTDWKQVSASGTQSLAIKTDGTLWAWGANSYGQSGNGGTPSQINAPTQVGTDTDWAFVTGGTNYNIAIKTNGQLYAAGYNSKGQLGDNSTTTRKNWTQIGTDSDWKTASCGDAQTLAIKTDGTLWAWGNNADGALGIGSSPTSEKVPTQVGTNSDWAQVATGYYHTLLLNTAGRLYTMGYNNRGQLGDGNTAALSVPTAVAGDKTWTAVAGGGAHTLGVSAGTAYGWGYRKCGQLGDGYPVTSANPLLILPIKIDFQDGKGHSLHTKSIWPGKRLGSLPATPTLDGYEFLSWSMNPSTPETVPADLVPTAPLKVFALWTTSDPTTPPAGGTGDDGDKTPGTHDDGAGGDTGSGNTDSGTQTPGTGSGNGCDCDKDKGDGGATPTPTTPTPKKPAAATVKVSKLRTPLKTIYLQKGKSLKIPVVVDYAAGSAAGVKAKLTWKSSKKSVVKVGSTGKIKATKHPKKSTKKRTATITVTATGGKKLKIKVIVTPKAKKLKKVTAKLPKTLKRGASKQIKLKLTSKKATTLKVTFKSSKKSVLTVDKAGKITAHKRGKAKITIKVGRKTYKKMLRVK
ncbi:MAG: Ig-like domain-containing protein [Actinomycetes bacterium]|jgi:alpha-tubulin suppressor-like RCC1 family protein|nr:Ig-like domain-containing protein [Actinomycetes bacterium]